MLMASVEMAPAQLSVEITKLTQSGGTLRVALYKPGAKFGKTTPDFYKNIAINQPGNQVVSFEVPPGTYAVAVYHDLNDNNKMDRNLIGYPKEPFGFSNNYRPTVAAPDFEDCAFQLTEKGATISISLID
ncbi:hypothetical protein GCM10007390_09480 [Persicitalea jodogahamensis]|uniref:DUF2141 domain-containing protein n=2 Tax=Persicitalea jodogahamensis TaxID=402147 RepID=A0A8J3G8V1_9BACT|nr:hypothetical protein GCM10007390_09480 [Persicitalea jodogahamensis]